MKSFKYNLQFIFLLVPFFKLTGFSEIRSISKLFDAWFIVASAVIIYMTIFRKHKFSSYVKVLSVLQIYLFVNTVIRGGFSTNLIRNTIGVILVVLLVDMYLSINSTLAYKNIIVLFSAYSVLNFILGKGRLFQDYLFGARTNLTTVATPIIMLSVFILICDKRLRKKPSMVFLTFITVTTNLFLIMKESVSTAIITLVVPVAFYFLFNIRFFRSIKAGTYIIVSVIYAFIIVIFQSFGYLKAIFNLLGENMTMTGRLLIWSNAIDLFSEAPIFGYGMDMQMVARGGYSTSTTYVHNNLLQFCMDGGIIALALFIILLLVTVKHVGKMQSKHSRIVLAMNIGFIMGMISEAFTSRNFYYVLLLLMAKLLEKEAKGKKYLWDNSLL